MELNELINRLVDISTTHPHISVMIQSCPKISIDIVPAEEGHPPYVDISGV